MEIINKYINWNIVLWLLCLQWLLTPFGLKNPDEFIMERMLLGIILLTELIIEWKKLIQTKRSYMIYSMLMGFLLIVLISDLYMKSYGEFASGLVGIGLSLIFDQYRKNFKTENESSSAY